MSDVAPQTHGCTQPSLILEESLPEIEPDPLGPPGCSPAYMSQSVLRAQSSALACVPQLPEETKPTTCSGSGSTEEGSLQTIPPAVAEPSMLGNGIFEETGQSGQ